MSWQPALGAIDLGEGRCRFRVWAPHTSAVRVRLLDGPERLIKLRPEPHGYFSAEVDDVAPGTHYRYRFDDGRELSDPVSRSQPHGVHGPSQVVERSFAWTDQAWRGLPLEEHIFYELHVGTFSHEGNFDGVVQDLDRLVALGVTAIELLPVAQFPGQRNWGYDGAYPFAVQNSYGGPQGLKRLVDACHARGLAVVLDVVYNHLGPEGNYLGQFGPYFSERYRIRWGQAINFDGPQSDPVRDYFLENALYWISEYHLDGLRLDAVHAIYDQTAKHFLWELAEQVHALSHDLERRVHLFPESGMNNPRLVRPVEQGGYGLDAEWNEDFHRSLHSLLTGERTGFYGDYGTLNYLAKAYRDGYALDGVFANYRQRRHGMSSADIPAHRFVVFIQNHDQTGNRQLGERLSQLLDFESQKLAAAAVVLSPFLPLLFMGEEYGETAPFQYFVSHSDAKLIAAVRAGRKQDFRSFEWKGATPDPQAVETFDASRLASELRKQGRHRVLWDWYRELLRLRKTHPALRRLDKAGLEVTQHGEWLLVLRRRTEQTQALLAMNFGREPQSFELPTDATSWHVLLDSADTRWEGPGVTRGDGAQQGHVTLPARSALLLSSDG